jgi:predicted SprT family Zn-dependent metalloprotease
VEVLPAYAAQLLAQLCARHPIGYVPKLIWKNLRVSAGMAYYRQGAIGLSRLILTDQERVRATLIHEYAHLLAVARHGRRAANHGPFWQAAMRELGEEPTVRHTYEVARNQPRQSVSYTCVRCGAVLQRSRRLPRTRKYVHAACGGPVRLTSVAPSPR